MIIRFNFIQMVVICAVLSSCTAEEPLEQYQDEVPVSNTLQCQLSLQIPQSRTEEDTAGFYNLYYAAYERMTGELVLSNTGEPHKLEGTGKWQNIELPLEMYKGRTYDIALWAHPENARFADVSDLKKIQIDYNKEVTEAFTARLTVTADCTDVTDVILNNPLSGFRIRSTAEDTQTALNSNIDFSQVTAELKLSAIATRFNALTGTAGAAAPILFVNDNLENKAFQTDGDRLLMDINFLSVGHTGITGLLTVAMQDERNILKTTVFDKIFFQPGCTYDIEGLFLGYPIEFDVTVGDWYVNSETITFD